MTLASGASPSCIAYTFVMPPCQLPAEADRQLCSDLDGPVRSESGALARVAARIADDARAAHAVVEQGVRVAVDPQGRLPHRAGEVDHEAGVGAVAGVRGCDRARVRREMGDRDGPAGERAGELGAKPR